MPKIYNILFSFSLSYFHFYICISFPGNEREEDVSCVLILRIDLFMGFDFQKYRPNKSTMF